MQAAEQEAHEKVMEVRMKDRKVFDKVLLSEKKKTLKE